MKETTKKKWKDFLEISGCVILSSVIVFSVNGLFSPKQSKKDSSKTKIERTAEKNDTITMRNIVAMKQGRTR